jgi:manganese oxidase
MKCKNENTPRTSTREHTFNSCRSRILGTLLMATFWGLESCTHIGPHTSPSTTPQCRHTVQAQVVALEQVYYYNRFGAFNPEGLVYALRRDVVKSVDDYDKERSGAPVAEEAIGPYDPGQSEKDIQLAGRVKLRADKRPRPLVLRVNEGDCLQVTFTNLLTPVVDFQAVNKDPSSGRPVVMDSNDPITRHASMHVNGLDYVPTPTSVGIASDGSNVGANPSSLAAPGETTVYTWYAKKEGAFLFYSMGAPAGGEGDGGQLGLGLFGAVNVQPKDATWYRSQVTAEDLSLATKKSANGTPMTTQFGQPIIDYDATFPQSHPRAGDPILNMRKGNELIYSDLNAVIDIQHEEGCSQQGEGNSCGKPYREFTSIFHDELTAVQAFHELDEEDSPYSSIRDGMGINYGAGGMGAIVLAARKGIGPAAKCPECKLEEFFLTSWANGDPAMVVEKDAQDKAIKALYPDDPSNVHHSYIGDPVRFRNMHAGPKETHVFHLHAHQWVQDKHDPNSLYLDSQTISPGAVFNYEVHYGGSGNRNFTPGDSIFHCHLYPHFAEGMWELWRSHDVFEAGTDDRKLRDGEIAGGTPNPAIVPLPRTAMSPMPTEDFKGYPFYIAGEPGHRPPQPPYDLDHADDPDTLQRHIVLSGETAQKPKGPHEMMKKPTDPICNTPRRPGEDLYEKGKRDAACIAGRVHQENADPLLLDFAQELIKADIRRLPQTGTDAEQRAIKFHAGNGTGGVPVATSYNWEGIGYPTCDSSGKCDDPNEEDEKKRILFKVNGREPQPGAPYADPCPNVFYSADKGQHPVETRQYRAAYVQLDMQVNKHGWHDPQARIAILEQDMKETFAGTRQTEPLFFRVKSGECVVFKATNLIPGNLNLDDFQVYSPTDTIGQHIHLVKFDVTSSDGSGNGWNYEDGTFAADEIRERIAANNRFQQSIGGTQILKPKTHRLFLGGGEMANDPRGLCPNSLNPEDWNKHPWCGAQTTVQRWWADPLLNQHPGKPGTSDRTMRTVFTHDHFGPSSHQHHGLYAGLVIEPTNSKWEFPNGDLMGGNGADNKPKTVVHRGETRNDGGPTHYAANIITRNQGLACVENENDTAKCPDKDTRSNVDAELTKREFNLAFADFAIVYDAHNQPVNPSNITEDNLFTPFVHMRKPFPEGISASDPGTQLLNYRNEPIPLRIGEPSPNGFLTQKQGPDRDGDMANVFSSKVHKYQGILGQEIFTEALGKGREPGDPATPLLRAYDGDRLQIRLIQGAQEENHVFTMHGMKWLSQSGSKNSGYLNGQQIGISEHFEFDARVVAPADVRDAVTDYFYASSATDNLWDGQWGLMRAFDPQWEERKTGLKRLPNSAQPIDPLVRANTCPKDTPRRSFNVSAWLARDIVPSGVVYNEHFGINDPYAIVFLEDPVSASPHTRTEQLAALQEMFVKGRKFEPLILRAAAGDCIEVSFTNRLPVDMPDGPKNPDSWGYNTLTPITERFNFNQVQASNRVGLHAQLVAHNTFNSDGANVGLNADSTVAPCVTDPCSKKTYDWYAGDLTFIEGKPQWTPIEFGVVSLTDMADVIKHPAHGAIGALVIEPQGARFSRPADPTLAKRYEENQCGPDANTKASATVCSADFKPLFREFVLLYQDYLNLQQFGQPMHNLRNGDDAEDSGQKAFNYSMEPLWARLGLSPADPPEATSEYDWSNVFSSKVANAGCTTPPCDPQTPIFTAEAGSPVRFRVVHPGGHPRNHAFTLFGHDWIMNPWKCEKNGDPCDSSVMGWNKFSPNRLGSIGGIGPARHVNILTTAGGCMKAPGDYLYRTQEGFALGGGLWGIFRVTPETQSYKLPQECYVP